MIELNKPHWFMLHDPHAGDWSVWHGRGCHINWTGEIGYYGDVLDPGNPQLRAPWTENPLIDRIRGWKMTADRVAALEMLVRHTGCSGNQWYATARKFAQTHLGESEGCMI